MRQRCQRMGHCLARMPRRIKTKARHQRRQMGAQHGNTFGRGGQSRAGPKPCRHRQSGDVAAIANGHDHQIQLNVAVHRGQAVGFQHQRRTAAFFKPFNRQFGADLRHDAGVANARQAKAARTCAIALQMFMRQHGHIPIQEPADQGAALTIGQAVRIIRHRAQHLAPIGHRPAHIAEHGE